MSSPTEIAADAVPATRPVAEAEPTFLRVRTLLDSGVDPERSTVVLIAILAVLAYTSGGVRSAVVLFAVLAARDVVRFAVMRAVGFVDGRLLLLPLVRTPPAIGQPAWREAAAILVGPLFLGLLSLAALVAHRVGQVPFAHEVMTTSLGLAAFFLLPLKPYDGWKVLNLCLFSRSAAMESAVAVLTSLALAGLAFALEAWIIFGIALVQLLMFGLITKTHRASEGFKQRVGEPPGVETAKLDEPALRALYDATIEQFGAALHQQAVRQPDQAAKGLIVYMREAHARAARPRVTAGTTLVLLVVYGAILAYFVVGLFLALALTQAAGQ